jgi:hypothetical protein
MPLQLRRGLNADRISTTFAEGEPVWTTDTNKLFVGDGVTPGAIAIGGNQDLNTNSNVTFNSALIATTATVATLKFGDGTTMTTAATGGSGSTSTYYNLTVTNTLSVGDPAGSQLNIFKDGGVFNISSENSSDSIRIDGHNYLYLDSNSGVIINENNPGVSSLNVNTIRPAGTYTAVTINSTLTLGPTDGLGQITISRVGTNQQTIATTNSNEDYINIENFRWINLNPNDSGGTAAVIINETTPAKSRLRVNEITPVSTYTNINFSSTVTIAGMAIGLNNEAVTMPNILSSATTVLFQTNPVSGGNIIFNMNRFGVQWPIALTRTGAIGFSHGQAITPGQGANVGQLLVQAGSTATGTANTLLLSSGGSGTGPLARGIFSDASGLTIGTRTSGGATAFNSSVFDLNGGLTLPNSLVVGTTATVNELLVTTTATVTTLKFGDGTTMTTAPVNEADQSLNTTSDVTFNSVVISTTATVASVKFGDGTEMTTAATGNVFGDQSVYTTSSVTFGAMAVSTTATFNGDAAVNVNNTLTVGGMTIGLNNGAVVMPASTVVSSATTVLFQTNPVSGGNIIFNMNRFGVAWPLAITRTGGIAFSHGQQIFPGQTTGLGALNVQAGSTATGTGNQLLLSSGGSGTGPLARGVFNDGTGFTIGTRTSGGATAFNSSVFDLNGGLTLPNSLVVGTTATVNELLVTTTATVNSLTVTTTAGVSDLSVTNTATVNEVVVGPDLRAIRSQGYNTIGVDGNWRVGNVLEVGGGSASGYVNSVGSHNLIIQTGSGLGPGGSAVFQYGDTAGVNLYSGNSQEFTVATFNTTSNTINYGLTVNGALTYDRTYGCFHKVTNVTVPAADTVYEFDWYTTATAHISNHNVTVTSGEPTRVNIAAAGAYRVFVELSGVNGDNADRVAWIWLAKNGTDISETTVKFTLRKDTSSMLIKDWIIDSVAANDYIQVRFAVDNASGISLQYNAAQTTPYARPAAPSATITVAPIGA